MKEVDTGAVLDAFRKNERTQEGLPDVLCRVRRPRACPGGRPGDRGDGRGGARGDYAVISPFLRRISRQKDDAGEGILQI